MLTSLPAKAVPFVNTRDGLTLAQAIVDTVRDPKARTVQSEEARFRLEDAHQRVLSVSAVV